MVVSFSAEPLELPKAVVTDTTKEIARPSSYTKWEEWLTAV
jgi:hypothetical protein